MRELAIGGDRGWHPGARRVARRRDESLVVPDQRARLGATAELLRAAGASSVRTDVAAVSAVAVGVGRLADVLARALECVPRSALGTSLSPLRLCAVLPAPDAPQLERALARAVRLTLAAARAGGERGLGCHGAIALAKGRVVRRDAQRDREVPFGRKRVALHVVLELSGLAQKLGCFSRRFELSSIASRIRPKHSEAPAMSPKSARQRASKRRAST